VIILKEKDVKGITLNSRVNSDASANLYTVLRNEVVQSHNRYAQLASDVL
jgi:hypothetical protein